MEKENTGGNTAPRERKAFKFDLESVSEGGEFSGYAAVFGNVDSGGDVIEKGAFAKTIVADFDRIKILSQHADYDLPIGKPLELREDDKGLFIHGKISDTAKGRDIQTLLKDGVLTELSIGYDAIDFEFDGDTHVRHLKELRLWEVSIVTWAMNELAQIDEVKSLAESLRLEAKSGKLSHARLEALKPFIAVVRELVEILGPFLEAPKQDDDPPPANPGTQSNAKQIKPVTQAKKAKMVFTITSTKK